MKKSGGGNDGLYERVNVEEQERIVKKFKYTKDIQFGFTDNAIAINIEEYSVLISFTDINIKNIALFNRFKIDESVFDGKYTKSKNVPAFKNASNGDRLKNSRTFEQDGKVILNYYIYYNGERANEEKYSKALNFAISKIKEMVKVDTKMINDNYNGDNLILYSSGFKIVLGKNKIDNEEKAKYNQFLNTDVEFVTFNYDPKVVEINKDQLKYMKDNFSKVFLYDCVDYSTDIGTYNEKTGEWESEYKLELPLYDLYYNQLRYYYYSGGEKHYYRYSSTNEYYYDNNFKDFYVTSDNNKLVNKDDLLDYFIKSKEELVQQIYEDSPDIWNYQDINRNNYIVETKDDGNIMVAFPYTVYYTEYDTQKDVYYDTKTYFNLENNSINNYGYYREFELYCGIE